MLLTVRKPPPLEENKMGLTHVPVELRSFGSKNTFKANFLVDTGALDSMVPASELRKIGIQPVGKRTYELASGELLDYEYGHAEVSFLDEIIATHIVFGPDYSEPVLGKIALLSADFIVDPANERLRRRRARPPKRVT